MAGEKMTEDKPESRTQGHHLSGRQTAHLSPISAAGRGIIFISLLLQTDVLCASALPERRSGARSVGRLFQLRGLLDGFAVGGGCGIACYRSISRETGAGPAVGMAACWRSSTAALWGLHQRKRPGSRTDRHGGPARAQQKGHLDSCSIFEPGCSGPSAARQRLKVILAKCCG